MSLEPSEEYVDILCDILKESEQNDGRPLAEHENMVEQVYNTEAWQFLNYCCDELLFSNVEKLMSYPQLQGCHGPWKVMENLKKSVM